MGAAASSGLNVDCSPRSIGEAIRHWADLQPECTAIVSSQFSPLSYRELQTQIDDLNAALRVSGFGRNARIVVALPDGAVAALATVGIVCSAVAILLDPRLTIAEIEARYRSLRPQAVLLFHNTNSTARTVAIQQRLTIIEVKLPITTELSTQFVAPNIKEISRDNGPDLADPAFILQTSGTTAEPKLVPVAHRSVLEHGKRMRVSYGLTPQDRCLCAIPVFHGQGLEHTILTPLLTGGSIAFPESATRLDISEWFCDLQPTWYSGGPTLHRAVAEKVGATPVAPIHSLRFIVSGGASLPTDVHERLQAVFGAPVLQHYGCNEACLVSTNALPPGASKAGTCGVPPFNTVAVVDEGGRRLSPGEKGEILLRGPTVMSGYLDDPELNRAAFTDGWFRTGDIGSLDEDGFLTLHGREKELINRGAEKIAPLEIEGVLMRHPEIIEAAAYSVAHPRLGENVAAAVVVRPGAKVTQTELQAFLAEKLAWFKIPRRISFIDEIPKGPTGKVQRHRLAELLK